MKNGRLTELSWLEDAVEDGILGQTEALKFIFRQPDSSPAPTDRKLKMLTLVYCVMGQLIRHATV